MNTQPYRILVVAAHPDDAELGAGASVARWGEEGHHVTFLIMTAGANGPGAVSQRVHEQEEAARVLGADLMWGGLPDGTVSQYERDAIHAVEQAILSVNANVVLAHDGQDTHQDHRAVSEAAIGASRRLSRVLLYESPSTYGFAPDLYVAIQESHLLMKSKALRCHSSQVKASAMVDEEAMYAQARFRGFQSRNGPLSEGFRAVRFTI